MTIIEAIQKVLRQEKKSLTVDELYKLIEKNKLYSFSAKYPKGVVAGQIRRHCIGIDFPTANPVKYFKLVGRNKYDLAKKGEHSKVAEIPPKTHQKDKLPEEVIHDSYSSHIKLLEQQLLDTILQADPAFFERLVIDLLLKMGYGENGSSQHTGKSQDGGIDGEILQDSLGLDRIYIQAKRYDTKNSIGRPDVQKFVGALENITKGVFLTTSTFTKQAITYANNQQQKHLVLIDGKRLTNLMIKYGIGIQEVQTYTTFRIDKDYFSID